MKKVFTISVLLLLVLLNKTTYSYPEFPFHVTISEKVYPRYIFTNGGTDLFKETLRKENIIAKYNIPIDTSNKLALGDVLVQSYCEKDIYTLRKCDFGYPCYIMKGNSIVRSIYLDSFDLPEGYRPNGTNGGVTPLIIDSSKIILQVSTFLRPNLSENYTIKAELIYLYDINTDSIQKIDKIYNPNTGDSLKFILPVRIFDYDIGGGVIYGSMFSQEKLDQLAFGNSSDSVTISNARFTYDAAKNEFKVISNVSNLVRKIPANANGDSTSSALYREYPFGCFWVETGYDDYYHRDTDTLFVYDKRIDSISSYSLNDYTQYRPNTISSVSSSLDGTIILRNCHNSFFLLRPDGKMDVEDRLGILFSYFTDTTFIVSTGDKEGNIYFAPQYFRTFFKLSPDGELSEITLGAETTAAAHIFYICNSDFWVYQDTVFKYLHMLAYTGISDDVLATRRGARRVLYDLNYDPTASAENTKIPSLSPSLHIDKIYPNPASNVINFCISGNNGLDPEISSLRIINASGAETADLTSLLIPNDLHKQIASFNVSSLPPGTYFIYASDKSGKSKVSRKFMVK